MGNFNVTRKFNFYRGFVDFDEVLRYFDWNFRRKSLTIDLTDCESSNFQAMTMLIQYAWHLTMNGCTVTFKYGRSRVGPTGILEPE